MLAVILFRFLVEASANWAEVFEGIFLKVLLLFNSYKRKEEKGKNSIKSKN